MKKILISVALMVITLMPVNASAYSNEDIEYIDNLPKTVSPLLVVESNPTPIYLGDKYLFHTIGTQTCVLYPIKEFTERLGGKLTYEPEGKKGHDTSRN